MQRIDVDGKSGINTAMKTIRLLTIGNSFSRDATTYLEEIARSGGRAEFAIGRCDIGGCSLQKHWNLAEYTARHPEYRPYRLRDRPEGGAVEVNLQEALAIEPWDFVTLQQFSGWSWIRSTFEPYLGQLMALVRQRAPTARVLLHQTWSYRSDSPFLPEHGLTDETMFELIRQNYAHFAAHYGCGILPSGEAVQRARRAPGRTFRWPEPDFAYTLAEPPALPRQEHSLSVGWFWNIAGTPDGIPKLMLDANHLNTRGRYLTGCVWYERLTGADVRAVTYRPPEIPSDDAVFLREVAHEAASAYADD